MSRPVTYQVWQCTYARGVRPRSQWLFNVGVYGEPDDPDMVLDYSFWVLRNGEDVYVVDTGCRREVAERHRLEWLAEPTDSLAVAGVEPAEVGNVLLTHLHYDHAGNLSLFPRAQVTCHEDEVEFWKTDGRTRAQFMATAEADDLDELAAVERQGRLSTIRGGGADLWPGVEALRVGGHTPGQLIVRVDTDRGPLLLASDAAHVYAQIEHSWPFGVFVDLRDSYCALDTLRTLSDGDLRRVVPGHDPLVRQRAEPGPGGDSVFVTRLA